MPSPRLGTVAYRKTLEWGGGVATKIADRLLNVPDLPANNDQLLTSDDRKARIYQQAIKLPTVSAKWQCDTITPYFGMSLVADLFAMVRGHREATALS